MLSSDAVPFMQLIAQQPQRWAELPAVRDRRIFEVMFFRLRFGNPNVFDFLSSMRKTSTALKRGD